MDQNKTGKYLKYAIGEILLVVIGIFIALQLNLWKESYDLNTVRQNYYQQLIEDINKDKVIIREYIANMDTLKSDYNSYIESFKGPVMSVEEGASKLRKLSFGGLVTSFNTSTVASLEETGDIKILTQEIRNKLLDLKRTQDLLTEQIKYNSISQIRFLEEFYLAIGSRDLPDRLQSQPKIEEYLAEEIDRPKAFIALEATINWKISTDKSDRFKEVLTDLDYLAGLITTELDD